MPGPPPLSRTAWLCRRLSSGRLSPYERWPALPRRSAAEGPRALRSASAQPDLK